MTEPFPPTLNAPGESDNADEEAAHAACGSCLQPSGPEVRARQDGGAPTRVTGLVPPEDLGFLKLVWCDNGKIYK